MSTNARNIYISCDGRIDLLSVLVAAVTTWETGANIIVVLA
jgi:hypothetical protein